jgi:hypothetical protein
MSSMIRSTRPGSPASASAPCRSSSARVIAPGASPSMTTMCRSPGLPATLATCPASSAISTLEPESSTMNFASSGSVVGYTVVVAAPAHMTPKSASTHSSLVPDRIATRSSGRTPSPISPAAIAVARSPTCRQVSQPTCSSAVG